MKKIPIIIRIILTLLMIYGAYTETGKWTASILFLIFIAIEINGHLIRRLIHGRKKD